VLELFLEKKPLPIAQLESWINEDFIWGTFIFSATTYMTFFSGGKGAQGFHVKASLNVQFKFRISQNAKWDFLYSWVSPGTKKLSIVRLWNLWPNSPSSVALGWNIPCACFSDQITIILLQSSSSYSSEHTFLPACLQRHFEAVLHIEFIGDEENLQDFLETSCDLLGKNDMSSLFWLARICHSRGVRDICLLL